MKVFSLRLKSVLITAVIILAVVGSVLFVASKVTDAVSAQARMIPIYNVETSSNKVAVTFNCATGTDDIDTILGTLDSYGVKATFFFLGSWADDHTDAAAKIYEAGHEIGSHSYSHNDMPTMSYEDILLDLQKCNTVIRNITGENPVMFRAPSGSYDNKTISAAEALNMYTIQWDVDSIDWKNLSADEILKRVTTKVKSGSIIQLHTGTEHTAEALPEILRYLKSENFEAVTVGELIFKDNYIIDYNGTQKAVKNDT